MSLIVAALLGDRLAVGLRTLTPPTQVRILVPQPLFIRWLDFDGERVAERWAVRDVPEGPDDAGRRSYSRRSRRQFHGLMNSPAHIPCLANLASSSAC